MRFIQKRQKQKFTEYLLYEYVNTCYKIPGYEDFVIVYEDVNFGLSIKGMNVGGSAQSMFDDTVLEKKSCGHDR